MKHKWRRVELYKHPTSPEAGDMCGFCGEAYTRTEAHKEIAKDARWYERKIKEQCPNAPK